MRARVILCLALWSALTPGIVPCFADTIHVDATQITWPTLSARTARLGPASTSCRTETPTSCSRAP